MLLLFTICVDLFKPRCYSNSLNPQLLVEGLCSPRISRSKCSGHPVPIIKKKILSILILLERGSETALNFEIDLSKYIQKYLKLKLLTKIFFFLKLIFTFSIKICMRINGPTQLCCCLERLYADYIFDLLVIVFFFFFFSP